MSFKHFSYVFICFYSSVYTVYFHADFLNVIEFTDLDFVEFLRFVSYLETPMFVPGLTFSFLV